MLFSVPNCGEYYEKALYILIQFKTDRYVTKEKLYIFNTFLVVFIKDVETILTDFEKFKDYQLYLKSFKSTEFSTMFAYKLFSAKETYSTEKIDQTPKKHKA